jgi:hypothetical protein
MTTLDPMSLAFTIVFFVLLVALVIVIYVRFVRRKPARATVSGKAVPKPKKGGAREVQIVENGPAGTVYYFEKGQTLKVYWEFGGGDAVAILYTPTEEKWDSQVPWAQGRRREVLEFVAKQVIQQKAPGCDIRWSEGYIELVKG